MTKNTGEKTMIITADGKNDTTLYYAGYGEELTGKGLGSGALTGTNRVPRFTEDINEAKRIETYIDAKRIMGEIIDAIRYKDIEPMNGITLYFVGGIE